MVGGECYWVLIPNEYGKMEFQKARLNEQRYGVRRESVGFSTESNVCSSNMSFLNWMQTPDCLELKTTSWLTLLHLHTRVYPRHLDYERVRCCDS